MPWSVIVPTCNRTESLRRCLSALQRQTRPPDEILVVDDGSVIAPAPILAPEFPAVRWLQQANAGPAAARNRAARVASGTYLAFIDDDCAPNPTWLEELCQAAERHPGSVLGGSTISAPDANLYDVVAQRINHCVYAFYNALPEAARFFASNNLAVPRIVFEQLGGFDELRFGYVSEDRDLCARLRQAEIPMVWVRTALVEHQPNLDLRTYCRMFFRYGRGAARYHRVRTERQSASLLHESRFHLCAPALLWTHFRHPPPPPLLASAVLCTLWQLANAAGFFWEKFRR